MKHLVFLFAVLAIVSKVVLWIGIVLFLYGALHPGRAVATSYVLVSAVAIFAPATVRALKDR